MPQSVRVTLIALCLVFVTVGLYYRVQSQRGGEALDRTREGWPILIGLRLLGLLTLGCTAAWLYNPQWFTPFAFDVPEAARWIGVAAFGCVIAWLLWMFHTLGRNLTDTVVTRKSATFVTHGPYRFVRNPMYTGVLLLGWSLGVALGTWLIPVSASLLFLIFALRTKTEERFLIDRFGDHYGDYMTRVGRFFPKR